MPQQFCVQSMEIKEAGRSADGLGQSLRVGLTLSDQDGEPPPTESVTIAVMVECGNNEGYIEIQVFALERAKQLINDELAALSQLRGKA
jgi:hypothetical protein